MNQVLKDAYGRKIGEIKNQGNKMIIVDAYGRKLGEYDGKITKDAYGRKVGEGNLLTMLLR